jgi:hypothetical protein
VLSLFSKFPKHKSSYNFIGCLFVLAALVILVINRLFAATSLSYDITVSILGADTPTFTPTPTSTPTVTPTPIATPIGTPMLEHFRLSGNPYPGWNNVYNAQLVGDGTGKADLLYQPVDSAQWGYVTSGTFTNFDIDSYPNLRVVITNVDASTGNEIWVNDGSGGRFQVAGGLGVGVYDYNVKTLTGWSTPKSFYFELVVQSTTAGTGTRYDELQLYNLNSNGQVEHFRLSGNPHPGWYNVYNAQLVGDGTGKADLLYTRATPGDTYGYVTSNTFTNFNIDSYPKLRVVITNVDASTGNEIWVNDGSGGRFQVSSGLGVGEYTFNVKTITGWSTPKSFYFELYVLSATAGTGTRFDELKFESP